MFTNPLPFLPFQKLRIFTKYGISIPGVDYALNPRRNITVTIADDPVVSPKKQDTNKEEKIKEEVKSSRFSEERKPTSSRFSAATEKKLADHGKRGGILRGRVEGGRRGVTNFGF
eukprot:sb/3476781/